MNRPGPASARRWVRIPAAYFLLASVYIVLSGYMLHGMRILHDAGIRAETLKGLAFVAVTTVILGVLLFRDHRTLARSETTFRKLVETMPDAVFVIDVPGRTIRYANPAVKAMFGYEPAALVGENTRALHVSDEAFADFDRRGLSELAAGKPFRAEFTMRRKNGETFPTSHIVSVFAVEGGGDCALSVIRDLSLRKAYEERIRDTEALFREIAENLREVFWVSDPDKGRMEYVSPAYETVWGRSTGSLYRNPQSFLDAVHPDDSAFVLGEIGKQAAGSYDIQYRIVRPDGELRWIWDRASPIRDESGAVHRIVGIAEDITRLKTQEAELLRAQKMEALGQLTGGIAHDFNNFLTVIMGNAESLSEALRGDAAARAALDKILRAGHDAAGLTRRLLTFSREQTLRADTLDINAEVRDVADLLGRTLGEHVVIETRLAAGAWPASADRTLFQSSLMNLALNARDAMPEGGTLTIETANSTLDGDGDRMAAGDYVAVAVADTGTGMTPEVAARVFDPFYTTKEPGKGTGLGLSMVHGFIVQSGGHVALQTAPGEGARFCIYLPRRDGEAAAASDEGAAAPGGTETVLVVEDEPMVRALLVAMLDGLGYTAIEAGDGAEALELLETRDDIAGLISDVVMPGGMSGPALAAEVRRLYPAIKVLYMSGYGENAASAQPGMTPDLPVLRKPFMRDELASLLRRTLDGAA